MKQKWFVSCIGAVTLVIAASAFTGCTGAAADGEIRLQFNEQHISAVNTKTGKHIAPGDVIADNTKVTFTAKLFRDNAIVAKWHFGNKSFTPDWTAPSVRHIIRRTDGNRYGLIVVHYDQRDKKECTITFDDNNIMCAKQDAETSEYIDIASGTKLIEGTNIAFGVKEQKKFTDNKKIADFLLTGKPSNNEHPALGKKEVHAKYADNDGTITITYKERDAKKFKIIFDDTKIECKQAEETIQNNAEVLEIYDGELTFTAKNNKEVHWKAGKKALTSEGKKKSVTIAPQEKYLDEGSQNTITVSYTE